MFTALELQEIKPS